MALTVPLQLSDQPSTWTLRLQSGVRYAAWLVGAIACTGVLAWLTRWPLLGALGATFPPILPSGIFVLASTAVALSALATEGQHVRAVAWSAALVISAMGVLVLAQPYSASATALEFAMLPGGYWVNTTTSHGTAATYLLLAGAIAVAPSAHPGLRSVSRRLALAVGAVAFVALVGMTFRLVWFNVAVPLAGMALPVALGLLAAGAGLILRHPSASLIRLLEHNSPGSVVLHRLLPAGITLPLLVGWAHAFGERSGWFDVAAGAGAATVFTIAACTALILWTSAKLDEMHFHRARAETRADAQREWLEATLATIDDAVIAVDGDGRVAFLNPASEHLLAAAGPTAVGRPLAELVTLADERSGTPIEGPLQRAFELGRPLVVEGEPALRGRDGSLRPVEVRAMPIHNARGTVNGVVLVLRDARVRRARERAMHEAYAELDRRVGERTEALEQAVGALRESTALLQTFAASTPEPIFAKDREGRITMVNPAALRAVGLSRAEVLGRSDVAFFGGPDDADRIRESDRKVIERGEPMTEEQALMTASGPRTFLVTKSPLRDEYGQVLGLVGVATDITERKRAQQELEALLQAEHRLRDEAERANRAKDEFLAVVSHELRSPLNALKGWSHVLSGTPNPDPILVTRATQAIKRNVEHQTRLIDDLLDTSRIISGKLVLERRTVNLVEVVHAAIDLSRTTARAKQIRLSFIPDHPVVSADGDPGRLQQVIVNLLSNAIKFTPSGGVVEIALRRIGGWVQLEVSDNGVGIDPGFLPHVFDRFSQADSSTTRRHSGLGIGLALVRHLVELHGGQVRAASAGSGQGTTFTVELRAAHTALAGPVGSVPPAAAHFKRVGALDGLQVLVVDDDPDAREVIELAVNQAGGRAAGFDSGTAFLTWLDALAGPPEQAVLLLDIAMPGEDGFDVLARLRADPQRPLIPAVAVTALTHLDQRDFLQAGFHRRLGKPVEVGALVDAILSAAGRSREPEPSLPR